MLTLIELIGLLKARESRISRFTKHPIEQAFQSELSFTNKEKKNYGVQNYQRGSGRGSESFHDQGRRNQHEKSPSYSNLCRKNGHHTNDCRYKCASQPNHFGKDCWFRHKQKANI